MMSGMGKTKTYAKGIGATEMCKSSGLLTDACTEHTLPSKFFEYT